MIRVTPHKRGQVESDAQAGAAFTQQMLVALVRVLGCAESRELTHGPQPAAVAARMNAARVRKLAGIAEVSAIVEIAHIVSRIEAIDWAPRDRGERLFGVGRRCR